MWWSYVIVFLAVAEIVFMGFLLYLQIKDD